MPTDLYISCRLSVAGDILRTDTGEIRKYEAIPKKEIVLGQWSKPFHKGMKVDFLGVKMEIIRIKKVRKQLILQFAA